MEENYNIFFADWMEGKISDIELKEKISEKEFLAFQKINKTFDVISELEAPLDNTLLAIKKNIQQNTVKETPKKKNVINLYSKWAVSIAAMFVLFFGIKNYFGNTDVNIYANYGEQKTIALLDGSEVILNAKSTIKYNTSSWKNKRELFLDGEAYFKVTKGSTFTVNTKNGSVTVLGTQFNVNSKDNYFNVICYEGKVKVVEGNRTNILTPGKGITTLNTKHKTLETANTTPNWIHGESEFNNVPLKLVIDELEKQFHITLDRSAIDETKSFTGSFDNKKLKIALASVFKPMQIKYKTINKKIVLSNDNSK